MLHPLLQRQLKRLGLPDETTLPDAEGWARLLERVSRSYIEGEQDRYLLERSLQISSDEMKELYERLVQTSETRIAEERDRLRTVISSLGAGLLLLDTAGTIISLNPQGELLMGWSEAEVVGRSLFDLLAPPEPTDPAEATKRTDLHAILAAGVPFHDEDARFYRKDGTVWQASYTLNPLVEHGTLRGAALVCLDSTERKRIEEQLQTHLNEALLINRVIAAAAAEFDPYKMLSAVCRELAIAFQLPQAAVALFVDDNDYLTVVAEHLTQYRPSAIGEIIPVKGNPVTEYAIEHKRSVVVEDAQTDPRQEILQELYSRRGTVSLLIVPLLIRGQVVGTLGFDALAGRSFSAEEIALAERVAAAISQALENAQLYQAVQLELAERKRMQAKLQEARDAAMAASKAKSEFLAMMTHEIRTPMNAVLGMTELLAETELDAEQQHYVSTLTKAAGSLLSLINDVLDLSKIEAGHLEVENIEFDLADLVEKTAELMAPSAHTKGLELIHHLDPALPNRRVGDPGRLRQVLVNMLGNAIKFTEHGEVVLRIEAAAGNAVRFAVTDTGVGIPADRLEAVFGSFTQVDSSVTRKHGGTGLGLPISRSLVELLGGELQVTSGLGAGSSFYFTIPLGIASAQVARPVSTKAGLRVLVIDDNATVRHVIAEVLHERGATVTTVGSHGAALDELASARRAGQPFDLALLDARIPGGDSFATARALRDEAGSQLRLLMLLTPDRRRHDGARLRQAGADDYLVKPLRRQALLDALDAASGKLISPQPASLLTAPSREQAATEGKIRVLLVEDAPDNRLLIETHLRKAGHLVDAAENGELAFARYIAGDYDLVLMDVQMPVMDGYTATLLMRQWERENRRAPVPIIALTAHALKDDIDKSIAAGCNDHVTKPISKTRLFELVAKYARKPAELAAAANGHAPMPATSDAANSR